MMDKDQLKKTNVYIVQFFNVSPPVHMSVITTRSSLYPSQGLICAYTEINPYQLSSSVVKGKKQADRVNQRVYNISMGKFLWRFNNQ